MTLGTILKIFAIGSGFLARFFARFATLAMEGRARWPTSRSRLVLCPWTEIRVEIISRRTLALGFDRLNRAPSAPGGSSENYGLTKP
jgi:hypothetical protein